MSDLLAMVTILDPNKIDSIAKLKAGQMEFVVCWLKNCEKLKPTNKMFSIY